ncbi:MAG: hypothetical protein JST92_22475 [Deltaproteobacteria bacterium]|nr:hypothetical protein [Deltaproteobacteria bacterium]
MKTWVTKFDEELLEKSRHFLRGADSHPESRAILEKFGFSAEEVKRGHELIEHTEKSFQWEREGKAWNFLSPTVERREAEAKHWYSDTRWRYVRTCVRSAEEKTGFVPGEAAGKSIAWKLTVGLIKGSLEAAKIASPMALMEHRAELKKHLAQAREQKPEGAPPPKDTALVELAGWYERWRLLAQRVFRERGDLMAPYGLSPGKAPPRLRGKLAQIKYGERAASLPILGKPGAGAAVPEPTAAELRGEAEVESPSLH